MAHGSRVVAHYSIDIVFGGRLVLRNLDSHETSLEQRTRWNTGFAVEDPALCVVI